MSLLPEHLRGDERLAALETIIREEFADLRSKAALIRLHDLDNVPEPILEWLAHHWHVTGPEGWDLAETADQRRALLKEAVRLHQTKGTPWSIERALEVAGAPGSTVVEGLDDLLLDGTWFLDDSRTLGGDTMWAVFEVHIPGAGWIDGGAPLDAKLAFLRTTILAFKPARSTLRAIVFPDDGALAEPEGIALGDVIGEQYFEIPLLNEGWLFDDSLTLGPNAGAFEIF